MSATRYPGFVHLGSQKRFAAPAVAGSNVTHQLLNSGERGHQPGFTILFVHSEGPAAGFDPRCDFCRIVRGLVDATVVWESPDAVAFFPLAPAVAGHTLIVPRAHVMNYWAANESLVRNLAASVLLVGRGIQAALRPEGMNLITSAGDAASQTVYHLHIHVVPRWNHDRIGRIWPPDRELSPELEHHLADRIRVKIEELAVQGGNCN